MREIKFRAWDLKDRKMYYCVSVWDNYCSWDADSFKSEDEAIIMQYAGIRDKNNKEIYEGDIVTLRRIAYPKHPLQHEETEKHLLVKWSFDGFVLYDERGRNIRYHSLRPFRKEAEMSLEVIGNIYENPELLKESR